MAQLVPRQFPHRAPVAQHDDAIGTAHDLAEPVRDVDHRDAVDLQVGDHLQQPLRLRNRQAGGRLVHDDHAGIDRERLGDLHHLTLRDRQIVDQCVRCEIGAQPLQQRRHAGAHLRVVHQLQRAAGELLAPDEDIGRDVEILEQVQLLVHKGDAGQGRLVHRHPCVVVAADADHARARRDHAGQHAHQRRFAGAVLADQAQHLAAADAQIDVVERPDAGIGLADSAEFEQRLRHSACPPASHPAACGGRAAKSTEVTSSAVPSVARRTRRRWSC
ncbi:hypothetical protein ACVWY2_008030 [Bradyrhizobium sp. JR6.1]